MPVDPVMLNVKFRDPNRKRKRKMPSLAVQTEPLRPSPPPTSPITPPFATRDSSPTASIHSSYSATHSSAYSIPAGRKRRRVRVPDVHLHIDRFEINVPSMRPQMQSVAVQAGEPQVSRPAPNTFWEKTKRFCRPLSPLLTFIGACLLFLLERVGFGINLTPLVFPERR